MTMLQKLDGRKTKGRKKIGTIFLAGCLLFGLGGCKAGTDTETAPEENGSGECSVEDDFLGVEFPVAFSEGELSKEAMEKSVVREGNDSRLREVLCRANAGEDITIAFIGGSITQGSNANPMNTSCYAYLTYDWFVRSFPEAEIHYVNAGIGGTDSYLGVHRLEEDVLAYDPDLVIVEFAVNDGETYNKESYECLLRRILTYKENTAVLPLILTTEGGWDNADVQQLLAFNYDLPVVSYKAVLGTGEVSWTQVGDPDGVHPKNAGHTLIAHLLTSYFYDVCRKENPDPEYVLPSSLQTKGRYMNAKLFYAKDITDENADSICITVLDGFAEEEYASPLSENTGYGTTDGGRLEFIVDAQAVGICYAQTAQEEGGRYIVSVDGVEVTTIDSTWDTKGWNKTSTVEIMKENSCGKHTVSIESVDGEAGSLHILAFMISR